MTSLVALLLTVALLAAALAAWLCWLGMYLLRRWVYRRFPGPFGLPFLGNLPTIIANDPTRYLQQVAKKYGPVCKVWFGTRPWLVISEPDLVRKLVAQSAARAIELPSYLDVLTGENRDIELASAFFAHGEVWRRGRRAFEASIIHPASLSSHLPAIRRVLGRFTPSLERYFVTGEPLDVQRAVGDLMLGITGELAYGVDFEVDFKEAAEAKAPEEAAVPNGMGETSSAGGSGSDSGGLGGQLARVCREFFETYKLENATVYLTLQLMFPSLAPAIRLLAARLPDANQRRIMACRTTLTFISRQLMAQWAAAKHKDERVDAAGAETVVAAVAKMEDAACQQAASQPTGNGTANAPAGKAAAATAPGAGVHAFREVGSGISSSSFLAAMLEDRKGAGCHDRLSDIEVIGQSITFILASFETSSTTTSLALLLLAAHPETQTRLQREVDATQGREISQEMLAAELPYTEAVLKETLRLYPAVPVMHRHARTDIQLGDGRVVPRNTFLAFPIYNLHRDPVLWPDPDRFTPERFMPPPGAGGADEGAAAPPSEPQHHHPAAWAGFGMGPRMCVGYKLATMIAKATLVSLVRRYSFTIAPQQRLPPPMATGLTFGPKGGVWLNVHDRRRCGGGASASA